MVKLRVLGTLDEIEAFIKWIDSRESLKLLEKSEPYRNKGKSLYCRVYLDVELTGQRDKAAAPVQLQSLKDRLDKAIAFNQQRSMEYSEAEEFYDSGYSEGYAVGLREWRNSLDEVTE